MINKSREGFHDEMGSWVKDIKYERCGDVFILNDKRKPNPLDLLLEILNRLK
jgi:hypothetical protein